MAFFGLKCTFGVSGFRGSVAGQGVCNPNAIIFSRFSLNLADARCLLENKAFGNADFRRILILPLTVALLFAFVRFRFFFSLLDFLKC